VAIIKRVREGLKFNVDRSLLVFVLFGLTFMGIIGLELFAIPIASIYYSLGVGTLVLFFFMLLFIKFTSSEYGITFPVADTNGKGALFFFMGLLIPVMIKLISSGRLLTWKVMAPLQLFNLAPQTISSYETLIAGANPFFKFFSVAVTAGVVEEITLGFGAFSIGLVFAIWTLKYGFDVDLKSKSGFLAINIFASIVSIALFVLAHNLNPQYNTASLFIMAAVFRAVMNLAMFYGLGLEFTIGFHIGNNAVFLGMAAFLAALKDPFGLFIIAILAITAIIAVKYMIRKK